MILAHKVLSQLLNWFKQSGDDSNILWGQLGVSLYQCLQCALA